MNGNSRFLIVVLLAVHAAFTCVGCRPPSPGAPSPEDAGEEGSGSTLVMPTPEPTRRKPGTFPLEAPMPIAGECRAAILIYHHIDAHFPGESADVRAMTVAPASLDRQLLYLREHDYAVVPYGSVVDCVTKRVPLPAKAVVITFDDGWSSQYANALPLLEKYGMTATFFVVTDYVSNGGAILSWKQIKALDAKGMTIASHSRTHPFLTNVWSASRLRYEIAGSKEVLEEHLGKPVTVFAYPFGAVDERIVTAVKAAGYVAARGVLDGTRHVPGDLFMMKGIYVSDSLNRFARDIAQ